MLVPGNVFVYASDTESETVPHHIENQLVKMEPNRLPDGPKEFLSVESMCDVLKGKLYR